MRSLFDSHTSPLAEVLRPQDLDAVLGQDHLTGHGKPLRVMLESGTLSSVLFWGPPGCGKTTLAKLISTQVDMEFEQLSAVLSGVADVRKVFDRAEQNLKVGKKTVLFVDEIHRFNKAQQDSFLAHLEDGRIILIGATTENPSFELNSALLSRVQVLTLKALTDKDLMRLVERAEAHYGKPLPVTDDAKDRLPELADGDARYFIGLLESLFNLKPDTPLSLDETLAHLQKRLPNYDKSQDEHYNLISALHKSIRGSDPDAALYWMQRMLRGGETPNYIFRRMIRLAAEDVGLADPQAVAHTVACHQAYQVLGSPEGDLHLAQAIVYLATAPKSNRVYTAYKSSLSHVAKGKTLAPPKHILNAPTKLMKNEGYGDGYQYDHDTAEAFSGQDYWPETMDRQIYYTPVERGHEREIKKRLEYWHNLRLKKQSS